MPVIKKGNIYFIIGIFNTFAWFRIQESVKELVMNGTRKCI